MTEEKKKKVLDRVRKLMAMADGSKEIGSEEEAAAFASKVEEIMLDHKLTMGEVEMAALDEDDPMGTSSTKYTSRRRAMWKQNLAASIARGYFCRFFVTTGTDLHHFVGRETDRTVAVWLYNVLVKELDRLAEKAYNKFYWECEKAGYPEEARGYKGNFLLGAVRSIGARMDEVRRKRVGQVHEGVKLIKVHQDAVEKYYEKKYSGLGTAGSLGGVSLGNAMAFVHGVEAGSTVNINPGVGGKTNSTPRRLKS